MSDWSESDNSDDDGYNLKKKELFRTFILHLSSLGDFRTYLDKFRQFPTISDKFRRFSILKFRYMNH